MNRLVMLGGTALLAAFIGVKIALDKQAVSTPAPTPVSTPQSDPVGQPQTQRVLDSLSSVPEVDRSQWSAFISVIIQTCNGVPADANVRSRPGGAVVGYVPSGSAVYLTGRTSGDWHEVEAPGLILDPGQSTPANAWISGCFVP